MKDLEKAVAKGVVGKLAEKLWAIRVLRDLTHGDVIEAQLYAPSPSDRPADLEQMLQDGEEITVVTLKGDVVGGFLLSREQNCSVVDDFILIRSLDMLERVIRIYTRSVFVGEEWADAQADKILKDIFHYQIEDCVLRCVEEDLDE